MALKYQILKYLIVNAAQLNAPRDAESIGRYFHNADSSRVLSAISKMLCDGWISSSRGNFYTTTEGEEQYQSATERPALNNAADAYKWKTEALTGVIQEGKNEGKRSEINNAAMPTSNRHQLSQIIENTLDVAILVRKISDQIKKPAEDVFAGLNTGEIRWCAGCRRWGTFTPSKSRSTGWQAYCRDCRREKRRAKQYE